MAWFTMANLPRVKIIRETPVAMQSDKSVARYAQNTRCVRPESPCAFQFDPMESDLAPCGDSEKSSLPMSPILTAYTKSNSKDLTNKGW